MSDDALIPDVAGEGGRTKRPPPTGTVRAGEVAKTFNVTPQCVADWVGDGLPVAFTNEHGWRYFEPASVRRWVSANRPRAIARQGGGGHGGQREGSGRKGWRGSSATSQGRGGMDAAPLLEQAEEGNRHDGGGATGNGSEGGNGVGESALTRETLLYKAAQRRKLDLENAEKQRLLLKVSEVVRAVTDSHTAARRHLENMVARLTPELMRITGAAPQTVTQIEDLLRTHAAGVMDELERDPIGDGADAESMQVAA